jgi:hypothetical protein
MGIIKGNARLKHHCLTTPGELFTVPPSEDFTDGTWDANDLVLGEMGINLADDTCFIRTDNGIVELVTTSLSSGLWYRDGQDVRLIGVEVTSPETEPSVLPSVDGECDLGSSSLRWRDIYLVNQTAESVTTEALTTSGTVSIGGASRYQTQYNGRIQVTRTGATTGSVTVLIGEDINGNPITGSATFTATTASITLTLPIPFASSDILVVTALDTDTANQYPYHAFCRDRTTSSLIFTLIRFDGASAANGDFYFSFIAYAS